MHAGLQVFIHVVVFKYSVLLLRASRVQDGSFTYQRTVNETAPAARVQGVALLGTGAHPGTTATITPDTTVCNAT